MVKLLQRLRKGSDGDSEEENPYGQYSEREITEAVLNNLFEDDENIDLSEIDSVREFSVTASEFEVITPLATYNESRGESRRVSILNMYPDQYLMSLRISPTDDDSVEIRANCLFYSEDEIHTDAIGEFIRRIGYRGPDIKVDLESEEPTLISYIDGW